MVYLTVRNAADTLMAKTVPYCDVDRVRSYDVVKANELLKAIERDGTVARTARSAPSPSTIIPNTAERTISEYMQNDLKKIGVELRSWARKSRRFWIGSAAGELTCNTPCRGYTA